MNLHIYNVFDRYFHLRPIVIWKGHLQPYIWVVPSLFQEATSSDLVFSSVSFKGFRYKSIYCQKVALDV